MTKEKPISKPKVILVEGRDEELFFSSMIESLELVPRIDVRSIGGKDKLPAALKALKADICRDNTRR